MTTTWDVAMRAVPMGLVAMAAVVTSVAVVLQRLEASRTGPAPQPGAATSPFVLDLDGIRAAGF